MPDEGQSRPEERRSEGGTGRRVELGEARKGSFVTTQGDRVVNVNPADFKPPIASSERPPASDDK